GLPDIPQCGKSIFVLSPGMFIFQNKFADTAALFFAPGQQVSPTLDRKRHLQMSSRFVLLLQASGDEASSYGIPGFGEGLSMIKECRESYPVWVKGEAFRKMKDDVFPR